MTEKIEYVTARFPDNEIARVTGRTAAMNRVDQFVLTDDRLRLRRAGSRFGRWLSEREGDQRFRARSLSMPVGEKLIVQRESDDEQLSIRKVTRLVVPDLHAAPELELLVAETYEEFGDPLLRDGGLWYCRYVDGTTTVSRHGYRAADGSWLGAADDTFVTSGGMEQLERVANFQASRIGAHGWTGAHVIVNRRIYTQPAGGGYVASAWHAYGGAPHYHSHVDVPRGVPCL